MSTIRTTIENTVRDMGYGSVVDTDALDAGIVYIERAVESGRPLNEAIQQAADIAGFSGYRATIDEVIRAFESGDAPVPAATVVPDVETARTWFEEFRAEAAQTIRAFITQGSQHLVNAGVGTAGATEEQVTALLVLAGLEDEPEPEPEPEPVVEDEVVDEVVGDERVSPDSLAALTRVVEDLAGTVQSLVGVARRHGLL